MKTLDHSLSEPAHNLASDEILLDEVNGEHREPVLRFCSLLCRGDALCHLLLRQTRAQ